MNLLPLCLDIDGSIPLQPRLFSQLAETVDLRSEEKNLRLWASQKGLARLRQGIQRLREKHRQPWLTFFGSGDFHHVTSLLLETLPKETHPVTLVLIDNHPDWFTNWPRYHCGNWVSGILTLPWMKSVFLVGQDSPDLSGWNFWAVPFRELRKGRVRLYPYERKRIRVPLRWPSIVLGVDKTVRRFYGVDLYPATFLARGAQRFFDDLATQLQGENIYLSIDKDCLEKGAALTDWEQGRLTLENLLEGIERLMQAGELIGADVCGERAPNSLKGLFKRIDAGRIMGKSLVSAKTDLLNEQTNLSILSRIKKLPERTLIA